MSQTSLIVKMTCKPGQRDAVVETLEKMIPTVNGEEGTLVYSFHRDAGEEDVVWVFELYTDGDALMVHAGSDAMKTVFANIGDLLEGTEMHMATPTSSSKGLPS